MKSLALIVLAATASFAFAADSSGTAPVLRPLEPADSGVFLLPGPVPAQAPAVSPRATAPQPEPPIHKVVAAPPQPLASPLPRKIVTASLPPLPVQPRRTVPAALPRMPVKPPAPVSVPAAPALPPDAARELAFYCQKEIGRWTAGDARKLLGAPARSRQAFDERKRPDGSILAFHDPTNHYRELELDFEARSGKLRSVYVYPQRMTWQDVRQRWNGQVSAADAPQGRKFYSYMNRHLDVLVDGSGQVISLGLY